MVEGFFLTIKKKFFFSEAFFLKDNTLIIKDVIFETKKNDLFADKSGVFFVSFVSLLYIK